MWIGDLKEIDECAILSKEDIEQVRRFFQENDMQALPLGKYSLSENNYVNVFDYVTKENDGVYEAHKQYVDIHYVVEGDERVFYANDFAKITKSYDANDDYYLGTVMNEESVCLSNGKLIVFGIDEAHKAGVLLNDALHVKKAVFKIEGQKND